MELKLSIIKKYVLLLSPLVLFTAQIASWWSPDEVVHNYFTSRGNLVNTWFVKKGWLWTMIAYVAVLIKSARFERRSLFRFGLVTLFWMFFTQWLNGMPLMDRIFIWTGGRCHVELQESIPLLVKDLFEQSLDSDKFVSQKVSSMTCRKVKGTWEGGHDPSGHVFLMTLSICVLITELLSLYNLNEIEQELNNFMRTKSIVRNPSILLVMVVLLSLMMLFMTGMKYHSILEKLSGLTVSYLVLLLVWWLLPDP